MYAANVPEPNPGLIPIDLCAEGRGLAWAITAVAWGVNAVLYGVAMAIGMRFTEASSFVGFVAFVSFVGLLPLFAVGFWRGVQLRRRAEAALAEVGRRRSVAFKVALIGPAVLQPLWSRPAAILSLGEGRVRLSGVHGFDVASELVRFRRAGSWGKGGVFVDIVGTTSRRVSYMTGMDPMMFGGAWALDHELPAALERATRASGGLAGAVPSGHVGAPTAFVLVPPVAPERGSIVAGWYPDPAGSAQLRWWDGVGWTDHLR